MEFKIELINDIEEVKKQLIFDFNEVEKEKIEIIFDFKKEKYLELEIILCIQLYYEYLTFLFAKSKKRLVIKNMDKIKDYANAMGFLEKIPYNINKNMDYIEKIKEYGAKNKRGFYYFKTEEDANKFVKRYIDPKLVMKMLKR